MDARYDVVVLGATAAGLTAALALARAKRKVVVVDAPGQLAESPLADWAPKDAFQEAPFLRALAKAGDAQPFSTVRFHNADANASAQYHPGKQAGYFFQAGKLVAALRASARRSRIRVQACRTHPPLRLEETRVVVEAPSPITARVLLIAQNTPGEVMAELALPMRNVPRSAMTVSAVDVPWSASRVEAHFGQVLHVMGGLRRDQLVMFFGAGATLHVRLIDQGANETPSAGDLAELLGRMRQVGLLPAEAPVEKVQAAVWRPPAGLALELETHVAKRTLLIGTAGGFTDVLTGHTISPSFRSGLLAAKVAHRALDAKDPQGALGTFKNEWRKALADYLRPPNAAMHLLLPLLFVNEQMVARLAEAILYGAGF